MDLGLPGRSPSAIPCLAAADIPFEALRYGLTVHANELNPVASVILKAHARLPRTVRSLVGTMTSAKYGRIWCEPLPWKGLETYFPLSEPSENIFVYVWARTVACPLDREARPTLAELVVTKGQLSLMAVKQSLTNPQARGCEFGIVQKEQQPARRWTQDQGTIKARDWHESVDR